MGSAHKRDVGKGESMRERKREREREREGEGERGGGQRTCSVVSMHGEYFTPCLIFE